MENNENTMVNRTLSKEAEETKVLLELFFKGNYSDKELEKLTGISSTTVGRRVTNIDNYKELFNNYENMYEYVMNKRRLNSLQGKKVGSQVATLNNSENPKIDLATLFNNENSKMEFLKQLILTFRVKEEVLFELFNYTSDDINKLYEKFEHEFNIKHALIYVLNYSDDNQEIAKEKILSYIRDLFAKRKENKEEYREKLYEIFDKKVLEIKNAHLGTADYTKEEIEEIVKFHIKYAMSTNEVAAIFHMNSNSYRGRMEAYLNSNPEVKNEYKKIADYNNAIWQSNLRKGYGNR